MSSRADDRRARIGLLGGSFNPVHIVHVQLANAALEQAHLDEVQLIPVAQPWQKDPLGTSAEDRINMLKLAIRNQPNLSINLLETQRGGPTYTIDTVKALPAGPDYFWIMGSDQLRNFCSWDQWEHILEYVQLLVAKRPDYELVLPAPLQQRLHELGSNVQVINFNEQDVSSTAIRDALQHRQMPASQLPSGVLPYILQHDLYTS